jgi:hypothetical protein
MSNALLKIMERMQALEARVARSEKMEFSTAASLSGAGSPMATKAYVDGAVTAYAPATTTRFAAKNFNDTASQAYLEQVFLVYRAMKIKEFLLDVYKAGDYTITLRDYESNVLKSITVTGIADATLSVVFNAGNFLVLPGLYHLRVASTVSRLFYLYNGSGNQIFSEIQTTSYILLGGYTNYHIPARWVFYPQIS